MLIFQTKVDCQGRLMFEGNTATRGGAITLVDQSFVRICFTSIFLTCCTIMYRTSLIIKYQVFMEQHFVLLNFPLIMK